MDIDRIANPLLGPLYDATGHEIGGYALYRCWTGCRNVSAQPPCPTCWACLEWCCRCGKKDADGR